MSGDGAARVRFGRVKSQLQFTSLSQDDTVAVATTTSGIHTGHVFGITPTGRRVSVTGIDIVRLASGKIVEHRGLTDTVGLLRQLT